MKLQKKSVKIVSSSSCETRNETEPSPTHAVMVYIDINYQLNVTLFFFNRSWACFYFSDAPNSFQTVTWFEESYQQRAFLNLRTWRRFRSKKTAAWTQLASAQLALTFLVIKIRRIFHCEISLHESDSRSAWQPIT